MKLSSILVPTGMVTPGMKVRDAFRMCAEACVPAVPFCSAPGKRPDGLVSIDHVLKGSCLPDYMIDLAEVLGNNLSCLDDAGAKVREILNLGVDDFVQSPIRSITSEAPLLKAVAIMQKYETSYMFVIDGDSYQGVVTNVAIAQRMIEFEGRTPPG